MAHKIKFLTWLTLKWIFFQIPTNFFLQTSIILCYMLHYTTIFIYLLLDFTLWCFWYGCLTPKGPTCIFWQHRNFRQVRVTRDLYILGWNFNRRWGGGISFICTKFHSIWNYESKVMDQYVTFFCKWAVWADQKKSFFSETKIWN